MLYGGEDLLSATRYGRLLRHALHRGQGRPVNESKIVQDETFAPILYIMNLQGHRPGSRAAQRRAAGVESVAIFTTDLREAERFLACRQRLRHRQRQHRHQRSGDRRRLRRREGHRRRTRVWQRFVEDLHAPPDLYTELVDGVAARSGHRVWLASRIPLCKRDVRSPHHPARLLDGAVRRGHHGRRMARVRRG